MFLRLANTPRNYSWGSLSGISDLLGTKPSGRPEAELWLGTHGASPTWLVEHDEGYATLNEFVFAEGDRLLGSGESVPFLLKVLAAEQPLSLQAHPSPAQARQGFARENAAGIALDAPDRNYRDDQAKPEIIVAVSDEFVALSGFRPIARSLAMMRELLAAGGEVSALQRFVEALEERATHNHGDALAWCVTHLLTDSPEARAVTSELIALAQETLQVDNEVLAIVRDVAPLYPSDTGVALATLLNRVSLARGEAIFLPAGNLHSYVRGTGIELMNCSDNVLRGGLTQKHIDIPELTSVLDFSELDDPRIESTNLGAGLTAYAPRDCGFVLYHYRSPDAGEEPSPAITLHDGAIGLCTEGSLTLRGARGTLTLTRGNAVFASTDEGQLSCSGQGEMFIATSVG